MDIQEQIDQFLQIPEIKEIFSDHDIHWHVGEYSQGWYFDFSVPDYEKGFFLGAWNAWQAVKAQAVPEGFVLISAEQMSQWGHMANYAEEYGCPECYEARGYAHSLACEINEYFAIEAQEPTND